MKVTMLGHSAIAVDAPAGRFVIDPGGFTDPSCLDSADAVLLTHAHADHLDVEAVRDCGLPVWGTQETVDAVGHGTAVRAGESFEVLGIKVQAVGGLHEEIHPAIPRPENVGFFFGGVLHPGDQWVHVEGVELLFLPISAPWVRGADAADYAMTIGARTVVPIHDAVLSDVGKQLTDGMLQKAGVSGYRRLAVGESVEA